MFLEDINIEVSKFLVKQLPLHNAHNVDWPSAIVNWIEQTDWPPQARGNSPPIALGLYPQALSQTVYVSIMAHYRLVLCVLGQARSLLFASVSSTLSCKWQQYSTSLNCCKDEISSFMKRVITVPLAYSVQNILSLMIIMGFPLKFYFKKISHYEKCVQTTGIIYLLRLQFLIYAFY